MQVRHYDTPVALAAYDGSGALHLGGHIDLSHCRRRVSASAGLGHIPQSTGRGKIGDCRARPLGQHIVRDRDKGVLLSEETAVLADQGQTVYVRIHGYTQIGFFLCHCTAQIYQMGRKGLWIVRKLSGRLAVKLYAIHSQSFQQSGHGDAAD